MHFLEIDRKVFVAGQASVVDRKDFANAADREFCGTGESEHQIISSEGFQFTNGMNAQKGKGVASLGVVLEDDIKRSIDGDPGSSEPSCASGVLKTAGNSRLADSFPAGSDRITFRGDIRGQSINCGSEFRFGLDAGRRRWGGCDG